MELIDHPLHTVLHELLDLRTALVTMKEATKGLLHTMIQGLRLQLLLQPIRIDAATTYLLRHMLRVIHILILLLVIHLVVVLPHDKAEDIKTTEIRVAIIVLMNEGAQRLHPHHISTVMMFHHQ